MVPTDDVAPRSRRRQGHVPSIRPEIEGVQVILEHIVIDGVVLGPVDHDPVPIVPGNMVPVDVIPFAPAREVDPRAKVVLDGVVHDHVPLTTVPDDDPVDPVPDDQVPLHRVGNAEVFQGDPVLPVQGGGEVPEEGIPCRVEVDTRIPALGDGTVLDGEVRAVHQGTDAVDPVPVGIDPAYRGVLARCVQEETELLVPGDLVVRDSSPGELMEVQSRFPVPHRPVSHDLARSGGEDGYSLLPVGIRRGSRDERAVAVREFKAGTRIFRERAVPHPHVRRIQDRRPHRVARGGHVLQRDPRALPDDDPVSLIVDRHVLEGRVPAPDHHEVPDLPGDGYVRRVVQEDQPGPANQVQFPCPPLFHRDPVPDPVKIVAVLPWAVRSASPPASRDLEVHRVPGHHIPGEGAIHRHGKKDPAVGIGLRGVVPQGDVLGSLHEDTPLTVVPGLGLPDLEVRTVEGPDPDVVLLGRHVENP